MFLMKDSQNIMHVNNRMCELCKMYLHFNMSLNMRLPVYIFFSAVPPIYYYVVFWQK